MQNSMEFLKKIPIFSQVSDKTLTHIVKLQNIRKYNKGDIIFHEGDAGEAFFFVKTGKVKIYKTSFDGRDITLNILGEGSIFAEVTLFNDMDYPATVEVLENSEIGVILNKDIENLILQNTELALQIIKILNKRLFRSQTAVKDMAFSDTYIRITKTLIDLCKRHGTTTENGIEIDASLTRQDIADMVGTSRETVSRLISTLKKQGLILTDSKKIIITDINKLQEQ